MKAVIFCQCHINLYTGKNTLSSKLVLCDRHSETHVLELEAAIRIAEARGRRETWEAAAAWVKQMHTMQTCQDAEGAFRRRAQEGNPGPPQGSGTPQGSSTKGLASRG